MPDYDIPKSRGSNYTSNTLRNQSPGPGQTYDVPPPNPLPKELPLEWAEALHMLERLQIEATDSISRLLGADPLLILMDNFTCLEKYKDNILQL